MGSRYWDSACFIGVVNEEQEKFSACMAVVNAAEHGDVRIVTSALTIAEVLWPKGRPFAIPREKKGILENFFQHEWIAVRDIDRRVAEEARELVWSYEALKPKDSLHVATALDAG